MSMKKFAQSVSEDLLIMDKMVDAMADALVFEHHLVTLKDDEKFRSIYNKIEDVTNELDDYVLTTSAALKDYDKPSMDTEDVFDVVEKRY